MTPDLIVNVLQLGVMIGLWSWALRKTVDHGERIVVLEEKTKDL